MARHVVSFIDKVLPNEGTTRLASALHFQTEVFLGDIMFLCALKFLEINYLDKLLQVFL